MCVEVVVDRGGRGYQSLELFKLAWVGEEVLAGEIPETLCYSFLLAYLLPVLYYTT
jgi:hypothetical protein